MTSGVYIYLQDPALPFVKVGGSGDIETRVKAFHMLCPRGVVLATFPTSKALEAEAAVHSALEAEGFERIGIGSETYRVSRWQRTRAIRVALRTVEKFPREGCLWCTFGTGPHDKSHDETPSLADLF